MNWFIDTNVLIYAVTAAGHGRRSRARDVVSSLLANGNGVISVQVLAEFSRVCLGKAPTLAADIVRGHVERFDRRFRVLPLTRAVILEAIRGVRDYRLSYYDAQIWAAARLNQIPMILTEDFSDGQTIDGVRFVDPFVEDFDASTLDS